MNCWGHSVAGLQTGAEIQKLIIELERNCLRFCLNWENQPVPPPHSLLLSPVAAPVAACVQGHSPCYCPHSTNLIFLALLISKIIPKETVWGHHVPRGDSTTNHKSLSWTNIRKLENFIVFLDKYKENFFSIWQNKCPLWWALTQTFRYIYSFFRYKKCFK